MSDSVEASWARSVLVRALGELRSEERSLIELGFFEGLTHAEIAIRVHIPLGTVKTRIRAGLVRLRALIPAAVASHPLLPI